MLNNLNSKKKLRSGRFVSSSLAVAIAITMVVLVWNAQGYYKDYRNTRSSREMLVRLNELQGKIVYYDEVLTMSARMAASTGDLSWETRYKEFEPLLDTIIKETYTYASNKINREGLELTDQANVKLVEMEVLAFKLIKDNRKEEAIELLSGNEYNTQKKIYLKGLDLFRNVLQEEGNEHIRLEENRAFFNFIFSIITLLIMVLVWSGGYFLVRNWHKMLSKSNLELDKELRGRIEAESKLKQHQENLEKLVDERTEELQKSERRLKEAQTLAKIGSWELNLEENKLYWSDEIFSIFEVDKNKFEATYEAFVNTIHPDDREMVELAYKNHLVNKKPYNIEHRLMLPDGRIKYVQEQCISVFNKNGEPTISTGTVQNITEQKEAENEIKQHSMQLSQAQEIAHLGSWTCDIEKNTIDWSDEQFRIFGLKKQAVNSELIKELLSPEEAIRLEEEINNSIVEDRPYDLEVKMTRPDGDERYIHARGMVILRDKQGNVLKMTGTNLDITERKKVEARIHEASQMILMAERVGGVGSWEWDVRSNKVAYSENALMLYGIKPEEYDGDMESVFSVFHPEDVQTVMNNIQGSIKNKKPTTQEYRVITPKKGIRTIRATSEMLFDSNGDITKLVGHIQDITDQKKAEDAILFAKEQAEIANMAKSNFLSNISHEVHTPLNAILGYSQILIRDISLNIELKESVKSIQKGGKQLLNIINDILEMSKIEAGKIKIVPVEISFHHLLNDMIMMFSKQAEAKGLDMKMKLDKSLPNFIYSDERRIRQILINLISNAVKFTDAGEISIAATKVKGLIIISISDTGQGIKQEDIESIFGAFEKTDKVIRDASGTGLGLSISRNYARLLGGDITVESSPENLPAGKAGVSKFYFSFKYEKCKKKKPVQSGQQVKAIGIKPGKQEVRLLIVNDNKDNRDVAVKLFKTFGFEIREASDGAEAVSIAEKWKPRVIIMDIIMQGMGGKEATKKIKSTLWGKDITIIAVSSGAFDVDREEVLNQGADDYIRRPYDADIILGIIASHAKLEYDYEDKLVDEIQLISDEDIIERIEKLPVKIKETFVHSSRTGDINKIYDLIIELSKTDIELADYFQQLADDFDFNKIKNIFSNH